MAVSYEIFSIFLAKKNKTKKKKKKKKTKTPQITSNTFVSCNQLQLLQQSDADLGQRSL